jgi:signal transduction histidine kinase
MPKEEGGHIDITMKVIDQEYLLINVIDDGIGIENSQGLKKEHHTSKGMSLTQERVQLLNQIESISIQIDINQQGDSGTIVTIQIPI